MPTLERARTATGAAPLYGEENSHSYMDWPAILAGAFVAVAISTLLTTFGAAIGLSAVSPYSGKGFSATALGIAAALWVLWVGVSSLAAGGYLAGRMRRRSHDASEHESDIRDGAHGLVVWAIGTLLAAYLATSSIAAITRGAANVAVTGAAAAVSGATQKAGETPDAMTLVTDRLWRAPANAGGAAPVDPNLHQDAARLFATTITNGTLADDDKAWLTQQVAAATGVTREEAGKRVDDTVAQAKDVAAKARDAADAARRVGVLVAFLTAASLLVSAAAAWWAAMMGGNHRDAGIDFSDLKAWR